ncbi:MAG: prolipoprotein diacylglyceryl transferase, partial [Myxococcota bacterium]
MEWNFDPVAIDFGIKILFWDGKIRWYGICFMLGLLLGASELTRALGRRGLPKEHANSLLVWVPVGMILGAHFVHLLFYEPRSFIENPRRIIEIGLGLASHGGGLGSIIATYLFTRKHKLDFHKYLDVVLTGAVFVIPAVRIGNFFNSEIYGRVTDLPWGVVFVQRGLTEPRHPSQLYEAFIGFVLLGITLYLDRKKRHRLRDGALFYTILTLYFLSRFFIEWVKEYQALSPSFPFTMGQLLSVPFILFLGYMALFSKKHNVLHPPEPQDEPDEEQPEESAD